VNEFVEELRQGATAFGPDAIGALVILLVGWWIARILGRLTRRILTRSEVEPTLVSFAGNLSYMAVLAFVVVSTLGRLGINTASLAAVIAAAGLAIGFALQGSLANFAAGVLLILFRPIRAGDFVEVAGVSGSVDEIQVFHTTLTTPDNKKVIIGNAAVTGSTITNYSAMATRRIDLVLGIGYGDDLKRAKQVLSDLASADSRVHQNPAPTIAVLELGDSSVNIAFRVWVNSADYWGVRFDLIEGVKLAFDAAGIEIPFPQTDVHMKTAA